MWYGHAEYLQICEVVEESLLHSNGSMLNLCNALLIYSELNPDNRADTNVFRLDIISNLIEVYAKRGPSRVQHGPVAHYFRELGQLARALHLRFGQGSHFPERNPKKTPRKSDEDA